MYDQQITFARQQTKKQGVCFHHLNKPNKFNLYIKKTCEK